MHRFHWTYIYMHGTGLNQLAAISLAALPFSRIIGYTPPQPEQEYNQIKINMNPPPFLTCSTPSIFASLLLFASVFVSAADGKFETGEGPENSVSAIFVFGDSTSDPGNNNYVSTPFKSNFAPYGRDFDNQAPTGRFCNGRLAADFVASYIGVKENVPPYLDPTLSIDELMTGVSFASAGSGYDTMTPRLSGVISLPTQLEYFKEYKTRMEKYIGKEKTERLVNKAVFILSAGTNDFVVNYYTVPVRRAQYTVRQYQQFLVSNVQQFVEALWDEGARKIAAAGLPPMGCLPIVMTMNPKVRISHGCVESLNAVARDYNNLLQIGLNSVGLKLFSRGGGGTPADYDHNHAKIVYADIYGPLWFMIQDPGILGFRVVSTGCCGTGLVETAFLCNPASIVCSDATKYVFFDSIHPTEKTYYLVFQAIRPVIDFVIAD